MTLTGQGRVGIGTTSPQNILHLAGSSPQLILDPGIGSTDPVSINSWRTNAPITFRPGDTERARIDGSGRLLVGTSTSITDASFQSSLQVAKATSAPLEQGFTSYFLYPGTTATRRPIVTFNRSRGTSLGVNTAVASGDLLGSIAFNGAEGTNFLNAADITAQVDSGTISGTSMPGRLVFSTTADGASSPTERMRITSDGSVYFGLTSATIASNGFTLRKDSYFHATNTDEECILVNRLGTDGTIVSIRKAGTAVGTISVTGSATAYNTSSDYRLKENVIPLIGAVDRLNQLQVHRFNFIADPDTTVDGFIAHEAQAVVPECVTGTKDEVDDGGNPVYQGIDQSKLVPLLTAALQDAIGRSETLEAEVAALKGV
jgi:hypothetical protein